MRHKLKKRSHDTSTSSDTDSSDDKNYKKRKSREKIKTKVKDKKKRKRCSSTDSSPSSTEHRRKKSKKEKRRKVKKAKRNSEIKLDSKAKDVEKSDTECFDVPLDLMNASSSMAPMTKDEWDKKQSTVKRIFDETTGRHRLIKGDGEVIEEIVSRDRHKEINRQATTGDGMYFQTIINNKTNK